MAEAVKPRSITFNYLKDLAERFNIIGVRPIAAAEDRDKWIAELDGYIAAPECFEDNTASTSAQRL
jgi:hypothetical protein